MKMKKIHPGILKWRPKNMIFAEFIPCSRKIKINLRAMCYVNVNFMLVQSLTWVNIYL